MSGSSRSLGYQPYNLCLPLRAMSSSGNSAYTLGVKDADGMSTTSATSVEINLQPTAANSNGLYGPERRPRSSSPRADPALKVPAAHNVQPVSVRPPSAREPPPAVGPIYVDQMQRATVGQAKGDGREIGRASLARDPKLPAAGVEGSEGRTNR